ncbi:MULTISPECIES: hypothetical protein [unclassified Pseudomonas]|nr:MULTISPECIES: hypothetical protein [unclassified Pseudomonas]
MSDVYFLKLPTASQGASIANACGTDRRIRQQAAADKLRNA